MNKGIILITLGLSVIALSGCGKKGEKKDYKALYESASSDLANKNFENNSLKLALAGYDEKYKDSVDLTQYTIMDTGNIAFLSFPKEQGPDHQGQKQLCIQVKFLLRQDKTKRNSQHNLN